MDRTIPQVGQLPVLELFSLIPQRYAMIGIGALAQATIGEQSANPAVAVDGFSLSSPAGPGSLVIDVGPGSIYAQGVVDQNAYGVLPADLSDIITLQGISLGITPLTFVPPPTVGFATNYLVQVGLSVQDTTPVVLPFYNASNPPSNWFGPNNSNTSQPTIRQCAALIQAKAGIPASAGSQVTPAPDPGFFGLYSVTVANGATALTSTNWATVPNAPFIPSSLMAMPQAIQSNKWKFAIDTGTANALAVSLTPAPVAIIQGMQIDVFKGASANTTQSSLNVNGTGAIGIRTLAGNALTGAEMPGHSMLTFSFDGTFWQLKTVVAANFGGPLFDGDATGTNVYTVSDLTPTTAALTNRMLIKISFANPNTSASTLNIGFGANPIVFANSAPLIGGEITGQHLLSYNVPSASWELLTPTVAAFVPPPSLVHYGADTSVIVNSITASVTPVISSYGIGNIYVITSVANTNTGGMTANLNGIGTRVVVNSNGTALVAGQVTAGQGLVLADNGTQLQVVNSNPIPALQSYPFYASGTYTPTTGVSLVRVRAWAGGGGGFTVGFNSNQAGNGGGGAEDREGIFSIVPGAPVTVTVGAGGTPGNSGGASSFGSYITANPGTGATSHNTQAGCGQGGTGGTGGFGIPGSNGTPGYTAPGFLAPGTGGTAFGASITTGGVYASPPANFPGGGGEGGNGGAPQNGTANVAASGAAGFVIVDEVH